MVPRAHAGSSVFTCRAARARVCTVSSVRGGTRDVRLSLCAVLGGLTLVPGVVASRLAPGEWRAGVARGTAHTLLTCLR